MSQDYEELYLMCCRENAFPETQDFELDFGSEHNLHMAGWGGGRK